MTTTAEQHEHGAHHEVVDLTPPATPFAPKLLQAKDRVDSKRHGINEDEATDLRPGDGLHASQREPREVSSPRTRKVSDGLDSHDVRTNAGERRHEDNSKSNGRLVYGGQHPVPLWRARDVLLEAVLNLNTVEHDESSYLGPGAGAPEGKAGETGGRVFTKRLEVQFKT